MIDNTVNLGFHHQKPFGLGYYYIPGNCKFVFGTRQSCRVGRDLLWCCLFMPAIVVVVLITMGDKLGSLAD